MIKLLLISVSMTAIFSSISMGHGLEGAGELNLRSAIQGKLEGKTLDAPTLVNTQTCKTIAKASWWTDRSTYNKVTSEKTPLNKQVEICRYFSKTKKQSTSEFQTLCEVRDSDARTQWVDANKELITASPYGPGAFSGAACVIAANGNNQQCTANPCNQFNGNGCTTQGTAGFCVWYTPKQLTQANSYYKKMGWNDRHIGPKNKQAKQGCFRNPCNGAPGSTATGVSREEECRLRSNQVFTCVFCSSQSKMGCQIEDSMASTSSSSTSSNENQAVYVKQTYQDGLDEPTAGNNGAVAWAYQGDTQASCAKITMNSIIDKYRQVKLSKCQCSSNESTMCYINTQNANSQGISTQQKKELTTLQSTGLNQNLKWEKM